MKANEIVELFKTSLHIVHVEHGSFLTKISKLYKLTEDAFLKDLFLFQDIKNNQVFIVTNDEDALYTSYTVGEQIYFHKLTEENKKKILDFVSLEIQSQQRELSSLKKHKL